MTTPTHTEETMVVSSSDETVDKDSMKRKKPFDLTDFIKAVAALVAAVGSLLAAFYGGRASVGSNSQPQATVTVTRTVLVTTSESPPSGNSVTTEPTGSGLNDPVQWQGSFTILMTGYNLDSVPPNSDSQMPSLAYTSTGGKPGLAINDYGSMLARWTGSNQPTEQQCNETARSTNAATVQVAIGATYCVVTRKGRVAALVITSTSSDSFSVSGTAKVWALHE